MISDNTTAGRRYHHNSGFSGEVWIELAADEVEHGTSADMPAAVARIPVEDLLEIANTARAATEDPNYDEDHH
jgi:hypothetical protein